MVIINVYYIEDILHVFVIFVIGIRKDGSRKQWYGNLPQNQRSISI